jgi:hypothetical protein
MNFKRRYHRIDGWRGYPIPATAVVGVSNTGNWEDSPCRPEDGNAEIRKFRKEVLRPAGIKSRSRWGVSSNVFCGKKWVVVPPEDFLRAIPLALEWLEKTKSETRLIHSADLEEVLK